MKVLGFILDHIVGILIVIALIVAYNTNPTTQDHKEAFYEQFQETSKSYGVDAAILGLDGLLSAVSVDVDNYYVFSLGRVDGKVVSIGAYGHVFVLK